LAPVHTVYVPLIERAPPPPPVPPQLATAQLALFCGVDEDGEGGRLSWWKWGQTPASWLNLPPHPVVSLVSWSPEGDRLVMVIAEVGVPNLFSISISGTAPLDLTDSAREKSDPAWSPDGLRIAYAHGSPPPTGARDIYLVPAGGGEVSSATSTRGTDEWSPSWAPQGDALVYAAKGGDITNTEIVRLDLETGQRERLTSDPGEDIFPSWSPSGQEIAFLSNRGGEFLLYGMGIDGQSVRLLYDQPVWLERPTWAPNGTWLVFTQRVSGELPQVIFLDTVSGRSYPGPVGCRRPAWRPQP
jgi:Tol biopolymer transport system component